MLNRRSFVLSIIAYCQLPLLYLSYYVTKFFVKPQPNFWVIGVDEVAGIISFLSETIKSSTSVCLIQNKYYDYDYDYSYKLYSNKYINLIQKMFIGPFLLGYFLNKNNRFLYIWSTGFLANRDLEFKILKRHNKKIVCLFVGSDIRAPFLIRQFAQEQELDHFINYIGALQPYYLSADYDQEKRDIAESADRYADLIFNAPVDQWSYLKQQQHFFPYMYDEKKCFRNDLKFNNINIPVILHAPSSPFIKGTPLVRAAIKKLRIEGYLFEYIELQGVSNVIVLDHLKKAHIVLNQFYAFIPGVFGIEAMANHCCVLMSADPAIETGLDLNFDKTWMVTKYWELYDNLKFLLDNPLEIKEYADNGLNFILNNYTYEKASEYINQHLNLIDD